MQNTSIDIKIIHPKGELFIFKRKNLISNETIIIHFSCVSSQTFVIFLLIDSLLHNRQSNHF
jgi:hypothetical protein